MLHSNSLSLRRGQTLLTLTLLVGAIIVVVGTVFVIISLSVSASGYAARASDIAQGAAISGIEDASLQLARNGAFSSGGYVITSGSNAQSAVTVTQNSPSAGYITVISNGTYSGAIRKMSALFSLSSTTDQVVLINLSTIQ